MVSISSMNNACWMNSSAHASPSSSLDHPKQMHFQTLKFKWLGTHNTNRKKRYSACGIVAEKLDIDFSDPDWKNKYQKDFESKFNLPHLKDVLDVKPRPTTFSLMQREHAGWPRDENVVDCAEGQKERKNDYVNNDDRTLLKVIKYASPTSAGAECIDPNCTWVEQWVHRAGPRKEIYFDPRKVKAAIVTCGGLCPGLNDVIRQIFFTLERYGVQKVFGVRYGFRGFFDPDLPMKKLSCEHVQDINLEGGSLLGVSRGGANMSDIVDNIEAKEIDMVFILGGNGTHAGANAIHNECRKRKLKVSVVCVPKTIDNDILLMDKTFGFDTAVEEAQRAINSAYIEAHSAYHGIGLVKLMGRSSGFIAMHASLASGQVDVCLIPEVPFILDGPNGVLSHLEHLIRAKGAAVVCVAEGAGQELLAATDLKDASGNAILGDIGVYFKNQIKTYFNERGIHADVKYIDPTYMVRSVRANASDAILCTVLGQNAVHGAFAGFSGITMGICNTHYVYLPITEVIHAPRTVNPNSRMWHRCLTSTGQPDFSPRSC
ncbi:ATP-dependent 6-phosphofructokinase 5, chloroplastic-like [Amaranthus tricolor]|uniref:ATP-dependent 6-phosphofructokinase 5, chloroplastic-like n=1 Tax=Amaranthus tricolor TaxID=29722 RepID=UPI00258CB133|nr:ATP-dependent 6-phosphofructokinase 5, chloroplastic-like [Amaranthus tricolor]